MTELEKNIGYEFKKKDYLKLALTHSSCSNEHGSHNNNERLEFLGDSVLGFITAEYLYKNNPSLPEGKLTRLRSGAVCEKTLAIYAHEINLGDFLNLGKGEELTGGRERPSILSDAFEALLAAVYLDGGMEPAKKMVLRFVTGCENQNISEKDYKTLLQEIVQKNPEELLTYILVAESGPAHDKTFTVEVHLNSNPIAEGTGHSKKKAEQEAAHHALLLMGIEV